MNCTRAQHALQLDLDGELTPLRKRALRRHLADCDACRVAVQQHNAIHGAMSCLAATSATAPGGGRLARLSKQESVPDSAYSPHHHSTPWRRYAVIAAAVALCITGWRIAAQIHHGRVTHIALIPPAPNPPTAPAAPPLVRIEFDPAADVIAIPKPSHNPNITVLWIYPAIRTAEAKPAPAIEPDSTNPQGAHS